MEWVNLQIEHILWVDIREQILLGKRDKKRETTQKIREHQSRREEGMDDDASLTASCDSLKSC